MAQNVTIAGVSFENVPSVDIAKTGGGFARFVDSSDANAAASDIAKDKTAYVNGNKVVGTRSTGDVPDSAMIANDDGTSTYGGLLELLESAKSGQTVKVVKDNIQFDYIHVKSGVILDLNGKNVSVNTATVNGSIIDSGDGTAALNIDKDKLFIDGGNNQYLPLYNKSASAYHFFVYDFITPTAQVKDKKLIFWFKLVMNNVEGYQYFADSNDNGGVSIKIYVSWGENTGVTTWLIDLKSSLNSIYTYFANNPTKNSIWVSATISSYEKVGSTTFTSKLIAESKPKSSVEFEGDSYTYTAEN